MAAAGLGLISNLLIAFATFASLSTLLLFGRGMSDSAAFLFLSSFLGIVLHPQHTVDDSPRIEAEAVCDELVDGFHEQLDSLPLLQSRKEGEPPDRLPRAGMGGRLQVGHDIGNDDAAPTPSIDPSCGIQKNHNRSFGASPSIAFYIRCSDIS